MRQDDKGKKPQQILKVDSMTLTIVIMAWTWLETVHLEASVGGAVANWSLLIV